MTLILNLITSFASKEYGLVVKFKVKKKQRWYSVLTSQRHVIIFASFNLEIPFFRVFYCVRYEATSAFSLSINFPYVEFSISLLLVCGKTTFFQERINIHNNTMEFL